MPDLIGDTLGPYRILEMIGVGGMAEVYKAYQPTMDRYVAIKVIKAYFAEEPTFLQRFHREARAVARLEHAHILPVHDYGEAQGRPFLVMRYLEAGTLKDRLGADPLPLDVVNRVISQIGSALDYAHRQSIIHRDVKPSNILMDAEEDCFLTDFGLAKMMETSVHLTGTGVGIGTPAYMSPEQGRGAEVDSRTDVYSLGVMLYEMTTGRMPYYADTPIALVIKHMTEPLPLPRAVRPNLPEGVERVILKALAKAPEDRFETAAQMVRALDVAVRQVEGLGHAAPAPPPRLVRPPTTSAPDWGRVAPAHGRKRPKVASIIAPPASRTKYRPLYDHLESLPPDVTHVLLTFRQIERIIGRDLPRSAYVHGAWWSNNYEPHAHVEARAWMAAGWRTEAVAEHQPKEQMMFVRV